MATKFSDITWNQAESQVRQVAGADRQSPPAEHFREMANIFLMYIWRVLDGKHDWAYRKTFNLTVKGDTDILQKASITALDVDPASAVNYMTATGYEFRTGSWVTMQGVSTTEGEIAGFRALVVSGGYTAILGEVTINGANQGYFPTLDDWAGGAAAVVQMSLATKVADISSLSLKKIIGVTDTPGGSTRVWDIIPQWSVFRGLRRDFAYDDQVACYQRGDVLEIFQGPQAPALNAPVIEYDGVPELYTVATKDNQVQLFMEYYTMWFDLMVGWTQDWIGSAKDPVLEARINEHIQQLMAALAEA